MGIKGKLMGMREIDGKKGKLMGIDGNRKGKRKNRWEIDEKLMGKWEIDGKKREIDRN